MKTGYITIICWLLLCSATLLSSCIKEDDRGTTKHYRLTVKAIDSDSEYIRDNVFLYFFDGNGILEKIVKCELNTECDVEGAYKNRYSVIAFGYSADMQVPVIPLGTSIEESQIVLPTSTFANNIIAASPGDIFYGRVDLKEDCSDVKELIWMRRKVATLSIITRNLQSELNTTDEDFSYVVKQTYGTFDFNGVLEGNKVAYHPASHFNPVNKDLVAPMFYTFPSQGNDGFCIDIYKGSSLIQSYCTDKDENQLLLKEGQHTEVLIDFHKNDDGSAQLNVTCVLKDWTDNGINEGFN